MEESSANARTAGLQIPVVHAFEFDAGLKDNETFPGLVTLELDLKAADIPRDYWDDLAVFRIDDDGRFLQLGSRVNGSVLTISTRRNSKILTTVLLAVLGYVSSIFWEQRNHEKFGHSDYRAYKIPGEKYGLYTIYWPEDHKYQKPRDSNMPAAVQKDLNQISQLTDFKWDPAKLQFVYEGSGDIEPDQYMARLDHLIQSEAYLRLKSRLRNLDFLLRYVYPEKVAILVEALTRAHDYLFDVRRFKNISDGVDIVLRDPFPADHGDGSGSYVDQATTYPYIIINLPLIQTGEELEDELKPYVKNKIDQKVLDKMRSRNLAEQDGNRDSLHATCAHELFHVVQEAYHNAVFYNYEHFSESTAVLLESEAVAYFKKKGYLKLDKHALPDNDYYQLLETEWGNDDDGALARKHGYTFYNVLAFNRDQHGVWKRDPNEFLSALMYGFSAINPSPRNILRDYSLPRLMHEYALSEGSAILSKIDELRFQKKQNVTRLSSTASIYAELSEPEYRPFSIRAQKIEPQSSRQAALLIRAQTMSGVRSNWLGITYSQDPVGAGMQMQDLPVKDGYFVLPADDTYLLISQDYMKSGEKASTGYRVETTLAEQPGPVQVRQDQESGILIFTLPAADARYANDTRGRLLEVKSSHPDIKPYKAIVAPGVTEMRIPIEALIYGAEDRVTAVEQLLAQGLMFNVKTLARLLTRYPLENMSITESNGIFTFTRTDTSSNDEPSGSDLVDQRFEMSFAAEEGVFSTAIRTDKDIYFVTKLSVGNLLDYLRYARPLFTKVNVAYKKEIEKYESTFTATIRDVFSTEPSFDPYQVPAFTALLHHHAKTVSGPASAPVTFKGKDPGRSKGVIPGVYTGRLFVSFESNLSMKWPSTVTVTVRGDQTVLIDFVGEITEGALVATDKPGHYHFLERTMTSGGATYRPMEGGLALFSEDGSLVFTFIPTRLKRSYGSK